MRTPIYCQLPVQCAPNGHQLRVMAIDKLEKMRAASHSRYMYLHSIYIQMNVSPKIKPILMPTLCHACHVQHVCVHFEDVGQIAFKIRSHKQLKTRPPPKRPPFVCISCRLCTIHPPKPSTVTARPNCLYPKSVLDALSTRKPHAVRNANGKSLPRRGRTSLCVPVRVIASYPFAIELDVFVRIVGGCSRRPRSWAGRGCVCACMRKCLCVCAYISLRHCGRWAHSRIKRTSITMGRLYTHAHSTHISYIHACT